MNIIFFPLFSPALDTIRLFNFQKFQLKTLFLLLVKLSFLSKRVGLGFFIEKLRSKSDLWDSKKMDPSKGSTRSFHLKILSYPKT